MQKKNCDVNIEQSYKYRFFLQNLYKKIAVILLLAFVKNNFWPRQIIRRQLSFCTNFFKKIRTCKLIGEYNHHLLKFSRHFYCGGQQTNILNTSI